MVINICFGLQCFRRGGIFGTTKTVTMISKTRMRDMRKLLVVPVCRRPHALSITANQKYDSGHPASMQRDVSRSSRHVRRGCDGRFGDACEFFVRTNGAEADDEVAWS